MTGGSLHKPKHQHLFHNKTTKEHLEFPSRKRLYNLKRMHMTLGLFSNTSNHIFTPTPTFPMRNPFTYPFHTTLTMGSSLSRLSTTGKSTTAALKTLRKLESAAADVKNQLAHKQHRIKHRILCKLELNLKEVYDFVYHGSDKFFVYNHRTGGYRAKNLVTLTKETARLTAILEGIARELTVAAGHAGPSYILSNGSTWERAI